MMGAGKSTVGKELAKTLKNFELIDIDSEIEKNANMQISKIFEKYGEKYFRQLETDFLKEICKKNNQILATGGGIFEKDGTASHSSGYFSVANLNMQWNIK